MKIYYFMILWIIVLAVLARISPELFYVFENGKYKIRTGMALIAMSFIAVIIGLRNSVGDTSAYISIYNDLPTNISADFFSKYTKDRGFFVLSTLFKRFVSADFHWWLLVIAIICGIAIVKTLKEYSENFFFSLFLFITMTHYVWMLNGMRQFIAVSIIFLNLKYIKERRFIPYVIFVLLLASIHITALIMIPTYFIGTSKPWGKRFWFFIILMLVVGMSMDFIAERFSYVLEDSAYEGYLTAAANSTGSNLLRTFAAAAPPILATFCYKYVNNENDPVVNMSVNFSFVSAILYFCSAQSGGILIGRLPIYFDIYNLLLLPWLVEHCFNKSSKKLMYIILAICYLLFFYYKVKIGMNMGYSSYILGLNYQ